jgi:lipopolysaccharide transport system ATP-binding protein
MREVAQGGRTVLFVSHNMTTVEALCGRCILLRDGQLARLGPTSEVIAEYFSNRSPSDSTWDFARWSEREGTGRARITRIEVLDAEGERGRDKVGFGEPFRLRLHYEVAEEIPAPTFGVALLTDRDERIFLTHTPDVGREIVNLSRAGTIECIVRAPNVLPGIYRLEAWITDVYNVSFADHLRMVGQLEIVVEDRARGNVAGMFIPGRGRVLMDCAWSEPRPRAPGSEA